MRKISKVKINFEIDLEEILESAKCSLLMIFVTWLILNIGFNLITSFGIFFLSALLGILTAFIFWKKIKERLIPYYAVVCVVVYFVFFFLFYSFQLSDWIISNGIIYGIFCIQPMFLVGIAISTHLITFFIQKRWR